LDFWRNPWEKGWEINLPTKQRKLVVVGCGKLGAPLIACLADAGHKVTGIDLNKELIANLRISNLSWNEPGLQDLISKNMENIRFETSYEGAFHDSDVTFIIVPTPSIESGEFTNRFVLDAVTNVGKELSKSSVAEHLVVIVSTVMPGSTQGPIKETLLSAAGKSLMNLQVCYSPEFIALGTVITNMQYPDMILIGEDNSWAGDLLSEVSLSIVKNKPVIMRLTLAEAEISKIAINSFVTTKISFSNQISEICENTPGTSAKKVLAAIGADSRIGRSYLSAGTGYGGPCFPRDNRAFKTYANGIGVKADLSIATDAINIRQDQRIIRLVESKLSQGSKLLVVGLSYKPDTDVTEESPAVAFIEKAQKAGYIVDAVDEHVKSIRSNSPIKIFSPDSLLDQNYSGAILFVPSKVYVNLPKGLNDQAILIDLWGSWEGLFDLDYTRLGDYFEAK
jgi:UDPglucose 6-dehydrogenase